MVLYDEDGAPVAERMPETDELQAALQALHNAELSGPKGLHRSSHES